MGITVNFAPIPIDVYKSFGFPGADDLGNMFGYQSLNQEAFNACRDPAATKALYPEVTSFDAFLAANAEKIPKPE